MFSKLSTFLCRALLASGILLLAGCSDFFAPSIKQICEDNPQFCSDLNTDGWCRTEKSEIVRHRYDYQDDDSDRPKYDLLVNYENYQQCINKAAQIQHVKYRDKEFARKQASVSVAQTLKELQWQTKHSPDPYISYYQWSRFGYEDAKQRFVDAAERDVFAEPKYYVDLASIQIADNPKAARNALFKALSHYANVDEEIDGRITGLLTSLSLDTENYRMAYVWTKVTNHFAESTDNSQLTAMAAKHELPAALLDRIADDIIDALEAREFDAKALKIDRL
ncbi:DUF2989 domain-containing protein [Alteromonas gilva]|uniref:DUF2989 domain-containing protein n=1 Tax=Alteromonas gilva TaxID=2987522 RepID=A0ABT5L375_9ALTE|nr:DUF2989 domain-containing protein [Alteromonas gilva]MDC8830874.1 DUF2989 domain-containing protein [Alteromonas gilva]